MNEEFQAYLQHAASLLPLWEFEQELKLTGEWYMKRRRSLVGERSTRAKSTLESDALLDAILRDSYDEAAAAAAGNLHDSGPQLMSMAPLNPPTMTDAEADKGVVRRLSLKRSDGNNNSNNSNTPTKRHSVSRGSPIPLSALSSHSSTTTSTLVPYDLDSHNFKIGDEVFNTNIPEHYLNPSSRDRRPAFLLQIAASDNLPPPPLTDENTEDRPLPDVPVMVESSATPTPYLAAEVCSGLLPLPRDETLVRSGRGYDLSDVAELNIKASERVFRTREDPEGCEVVGLRSAHVLDEERAKWLPKLQDLMDPQDQSGTGTRVVSCSLQRISEVILKQTGSILEESVLGKTDDIDLGETADKECITQLPDSYFLSPADKLAGEVIPVEKLMAQVREESRSQIGHTNANLVRVITQRDDTLMNVDIAVPPPGTDDATTVFYQELPPPGEEGRKDSLDMTSPRHNSKIGLDEPKTVTEEGEDDADVAEVMWPPVVEQHVVGLSRRKSVQLELLQKRPVSRANASNSNLGNPRSSLRKPRTEGKLVHTLLADVCLGLGLDTALDGTALVKDEAQAVMSPIMNSFALPEPNESDDVASMTHSTHNSLTSQRASVLNADEIATDVQLKNAVTRHMPLDSNVSTESTSSNTGLVGAGSEALRTSRRSSGTSLVTSSNDLNRSVKRSPMVSFQDSGAQSTTSSAPSSSSSGSGTNVPDIPTPLPTEATEPVPPTTTAPASPPTKIEATPTQPKELDAVPTPTPPPKLAVKYQSPFSRMSQKYARPIAAPLAAVEASDHDANPPLSFASRMKPEDEARAARSAIVASRSPDSPEPPTGYDPLMAEMTKKAQLSRSATVDPTAAPPAPPPSDLAKSSHRPPPRPEPTPNKDKALERSPAQKLTRSPSLTEEPRKTSVASVNKSGDTGSRRSSVFQEPEKEPAPIPQPKVERKRSLVKWDKGDAFLFSDFTVTEDTVHGDMTSESKSSAAAPSATPVEMFIADIMSVYEPPTPTPAAQGGPRATSPLHTSQNSNSSVGAMSATGSGGASSDTATTLARRLTNVPIVDLDDDDDDQVPATNADSDTFAFGDFSVGTGGEDDMAASFRGGRDRKTRTDDEDTFCFGDFAIAVPMKGGSAAAAGGGPGPKRKVATNYEKLKGTIRRYDYWTLVGHNQRVKFVCLDNEEKVYSSGSVADTTVPLTDMATGSKVHTFSGHKDIVTNAAFSPDGKYIATTGRDGLMIMFEVSTSKLHSTYEHPRPVTCVKFSSNGRFVLTGCQDRGCRLFPTRGRGGKAPTCTFFEHGSFVTCADFQPWSDKIVTGSGDTNVFVWSACTGATVHQLTGHAGHILNVCYDGDGKKLLTNDMYEVRVWDPSSGGLVFVLSRKDIMSQRLRPVAPVEYITIAHFSPLAFPNHVVVCTSDSCLHIYNTTDTIESIASGVGASDTQSSTSSKANLQLFTPMPAMSALSLLPVLTLHLHARVLSIAAGVKSTLLLGDVNGNLTIVKLFGYSDAVLKPPPPPPKEPELPPMPMM